MRLNSLDSDADAMVDSSSLHTSNQESNMTRELIIDTIRSKCDEKVLRNISRAMRFLSSRFCPEDLKILLLLNPNEMDVK